ncbi:hypothetical protein Tco_0881294 [Tanacetum coccineum]
MAHPSQWDKGNFRPAWSGGPEKARSRGGLRETRRNMGIYTSYPKKDTFIPLIKTPKEILAMESVSFPEPPPLIETPEKQNLNKFCDYHRDRATTPTTAIKQPEERESRKEQRESHKHDKGGSCKRPFEGERSDLTDELTFPPIPRNQLTDEPIILEGMIEGHQTKKMQNSAGRLLRRNVPPTKNNRPLSNYGKGRKEQNSANGVCYNKISLAVQHHNRKDRNEKPQSVEKLCRNVDSWKGCKVCGRRTWKVQVDYSSLNKVCAKDMYPFPEEGEELESLMEYLYKCFLRLPKEYNQIRMAENDEEKNGFHTEEGVYCFTHMPKGLKNSVVTLQKMMEKVLTNQRGRNVEVYLEEIVVKSKSE